MTKTMGMKVKAWLLILGAAGVPLATSITCDPYDGSLYIDRYEDRDFFDVLEDTLHGDCFFHTCYDDHNDFFFWD